MSSPIFVHKSSARSSLCVCLSLIHIWLWSWQNRQRVYWTPGYNQYPREIKALLTNAITGEKAAIRKYQCQADSIEDPHIAAILKRIILDEELHVEIFTGLYEKYAG